MQLRRLTLPLLLAATVTSNVILLTRTEATGTATGERLSQAVRDVAEQVTPAVVSVTSRAEGRIVARGSGVIVDSDGTVVTNNHVVQGAEIVNVTLFDGRTLPARVRGSDAETDLSVLDVMGHGFPTADLSAGVPPAIGTWVVAIGNPMGLDHTVTFGIVSARGRSGLGIATYEDFLQTDAAINAGNSGGPLVDLDGAIVGINTAKELVRGGNQGLGFAIPSYMVQEVVSEILAKGHVERGWFGIRMRDLSARETESLGLERSPRVAVRHVLPNSPAQSAGLEIDDVVLAIGGTEINEQRDLLDAVARLDPGTKVAVDVWRERKLEVLLVDVARRPRTGR
jgi:S1-C subfamily serine protease